MEKIIQGSLFEEDYLVRSSGNLSNVPDIALTELVANAWDAGASEVKITIPNHEGGEIIVEDDGTGLTPDMFRKRWMTLGYNRLKNQGDMVEFPPGREDSYRRAYGRNGEGRHGMLCFADQYTVETCRDGQLSTFVVSVTSGNQPLSIMDEQVALYENRHGTTIRAVVSRNLPDAKVIREIISARFLHNPQFRICVNGESIHLTDHKGLILQEDLVVDETIRLTIYVFDSSKTAKTSRQHGIAFWVGDRLVGEPSWDLGDFSIDGRTSFARRHTIVVKTDDLYDHVLPDWSSFRITSAVHLVFKEVAKYADKIYRSSMEESIGKARKTVLQEHRAELEGLPTLGKVEVSEFLEELTEFSPAVNPEFLSAAIRAIIQLEKSRSGMKLLDKLARLSEDDIADLNRLLDDWSVKDVLLVMDEIDRRLLVIEALQRFSSDPNTDELQTLHPLVLQARWLFGPEFDSPAYTSNQSLTHAFEQLFGEKVSNNVFCNHRKRPDVMVLEDASLSVVCTEDLDVESQLTQMNRILILELKRGGSEIGRKEMDQATGYVEDLLNSGYLYGTPSINAFVVGHKIHPKITNSRIRKTGPSENGRVEATTFGQLISTAERRLFRLKEHLARYKEIADDNLVQKVLNEPTQLTADLKL